MFWMSADKPGICVSKPARMTCASASDNALVRAPRSAAAGGLGSAVAI